MRVIIAGGRDYQLTAADRGWLDELRISIPITEVVSGGASGADAGGEQWARSRGMEPTIFKAAWDDVTALGARVKTNRFGGQYNANAGFDRNEAMARYADAVILFPGGPGTQDMRRRAILHGLQIFHREP